MSERDYLLTITLPLAVALAAIALRYVTRMQEARTRLADEDAFRRVAERAVTAEAETASALVSIRAALADMQARLVSVESILKDVG